MTERLVEYNGERLSMSEVARREGVTFQAIQQRMKRKKNPGPTGRGHAPAIVELDGIAATVKEHMTRLNATKAQVWGRVYTARDRTARGAPKPRCCSACGQPGHYWKTCGMKPVVGVA